MAVNWTFWNDWCPLSPSAVGRCRRYFELHHIWGRLTLQETELWVRHHELLCSFLMIQFKADRFDFLSLSCVVVWFEGGSTSCWVKLNVEAMKKEYQTVRSKRIALGKIDRLLSAGLLSLWLHCIIICCCTFIYCCCFFSFLLSSQKCVGKRPHGSET